MGTGVALLGVGVLYGFPDIGAGGQQQASMATETPSTQVPPTATPEPTVTQSPTPTEPSPSIDVSAIRGIERNRNQISARVELNGASKVTFEHEGQEIGSFTKSHHKVFHELNDEPVVEQGEIVKVYGYWGGKRHSIANKTIVGV